MSDLISRQKAIDALWAERMKHSEEMERNLETCSFALRADNKAKRNRIEEDIEIIKQLPPAQPEPNYDEWCTNCKEYDKEKHSCPRWNKVIKNAVDELKSAQPEQCEDAVSRKAVKDGFVEMCSLNCPYTEKQRHIMCGSCLLGTAFDVLEATQPVTPKQPAQHIDADGTLWITVPDIEQVTRVIVDEEKSKFCRQFYMEEEQHTGKWIPQDHNKRVGNISTLVYYYPTCSECGQVGNETYKYCPHCGAKMEGDAE